MKGNLPGIAFLCLWGVVGAALLGTVLAGVNNNNILIFSVQTIALGSLALLLHSLTHRSYDCSSAPWRQAEGNDGSRNKQDKR